MEEKKSGPQPNISYYLCNITMSQITTRTSPPTPNHTSCKLLQKQTIIGWIQSLKGPDITRLDRNSKRVSTITRVQNLRTKMDILSYQKSVGHPFGYMILQKLHAKRHLWTKKAEISACINTIVAYHYNQGMTVHPKIFHFLFKTSIQTLLSPPVCQSLLWLAATSSVFRCSQIKSKKRY